MFKSPLLDYTGMFIPASGILCDASGRIRVSTGSRLRYNGRMLAQRLQKSTELTKYLGKPFRTFDLELGNDASIVKEYYFRENCVIEADIVNEAYIQKRLPPLLHKFLAGRICRFRTYSYVE